MPAGDNTLEISFSGGDSFFVTSSPEGNLYLYVEATMDEDLAPEQEVEHAFFRLFETGEAVDGIYIGSVSDGRSAKHLYWTNALEGARYAAVSGHVRSEDVLPEVRNAGRSEPGEDASGQSEDV